ncbi:MAG: acetate--CoA ligase family protein [Desulfosudaceae bacterium]
MDCFFKPAGVAIVGASATIGRGGYNIVSNVKNSFQGEIYPVNPRYDEILGLTCYPSISDIPGSVDMAIIFVPAAGIPDIIVQCAHKGVRGVIIQSAGFAETGQAGRDLQEQVLKRARQNNIRIWGPNCVGLVDIAGRQFFSFISPDILKDNVITGGVSMIVQSGMLSGGFLMDMMTADRMGFARVCSIGNKMDVNECDLLAWLLDDPATRVVGCYLEELVNGRLFIDLCQQSDKPVVVIKGGRSEHGARAALSHTASMAADRKVISGILAQAGVIEADDFKQMADICNTLSLVPRYPAEGVGRVAVLTYSGGAGILSTDLMEGQLLRPAELQPETLGKIRTVFPDWMPVGHPVDFWPAVEKSGPVKTYLTCLSAVLEDPGVDMVLLHIFLGGQMDPDISPLADLAARAGKPLFCWVIGHDGARRHFAESLQKLGIPVFRELLRAITCMDALVRDRSSQRGSRRFAEVRKDSIPAALRLLPAEPGRRVLDEHDSKRFLECAGMPVVTEALAETPEEAVTQARTMGFPVVLKGLLPGEVHKTEAGLVRLNLAGAEVVREEAQSLLLAMEGQGRMLVQKQVAGRIELIAGLVRDVAYGPCVMIGMGGVLAEILDDSVFALAPLSVEEALALLDRLRSQKVLNGFRDAPPVDRRALADILVTLGELARDGRRLQEVDINPLVISGGRPVVVDAAVIME